MTEHQTDHHSHSHTVVSVAAYVTMCGGPLDGTEGMLSVDPDADLTDLRLTLPNGATRHIYHHDGVRGPGSEVLLRYIGQQLA